MTFGEGLIRQIHSLLLKHSNKDQCRRGEYKFQTNRVEARDKNGDLVQVIFNPTQPYLVPKEMQELCDWVQIEFEKDDFHPLLIIANFIFKFLVIHPFSDNNSKSSRILTNFLLLQFGYQFIPYVSHEKITEGQKLNIIKHSISLNKPGKQKKKIWVTGLYSF